MERSPTGLVYFSYLVIVVVVCSSNDVGNETENSTVVDAPISVATTQISSVAVDTLEADTERVPDEQRLYQNILADYESSVRPLLNSSGTVTVTFKTAGSETVTAVKLLPSPSNSHSTRLLTWLDERKQLLTTNVFINQEWVDEQLAWNESAYNGVKTLRVLSTHVWLPDTYMLNNADDDSSGYLQGIYVLLKSAGTVVWPIPVRLRTSCKVDITYFPFDDQVCTILFGSSVYSHTGVEFRGFLVTDDTRYVENSEWDLLSTTFDKRLRHRLRRNGVISGDRYRMDYCNGLRADSNSSDENRELNSGVPSAECMRHRQPTEDDPPRSEVHQTADINMYTELSYRVHIRRRSFYFAFNVIVPCLMLSILTLLTFWLPATSNEKVSLGLSVFLTYSMFMLLIAEEVPTTSESVPLIVIVINCYNRGYRSGHAPRWILQLMLKWISLPLRMKHDVELTAANLRLADEIEKSYECPVHQKTTLKTRPPTPRPTRRLQPQLSEDTTSLRVDQQATSSGKFLPLKASENSSGSSEDETPSHSIDGNGLSDKGRKDPTSKSLASNGAWTSLDHRRVNTFNTGCLKWDDAGGSGSESISGKNDSTVDSSPPVIAVCRQLGINISQTTAVHSTASTSDIGGKLRPRFGCHLLPLPPTIYAIEGDDENDSSDGSTSNKPPGGTRNTQTTPSARSSICYDDVSRALICKTEAEACPLAKALIDRKRAVVEWQSMAAVLDRLLFWIFLVATLVAYLVILVVVPALKPSRLSQHSDN